MQFQAPPKDLLEKAKFSGRSDEGLNSLAAKWA